MAAAADDSDPERMCRYCLSTDDDGGGELISPCACKGGQRWVHAACLLAWQRSVLVTQPTHPAFYADDVRQSVCNVCRTPYDRPPPSRRELMASFTGPELAALLEPGALIVCERETSAAMAAAMRASAQLGRRSSLQHWIRGVYAITRVEPSGASDGEDCVVAVNLTRPLGADALPPPLQEAARRLLSARRPRHARQAAAAPAAAASSDARAVPGALAGAPAAAASMDCDLAGGCGDDGGGAEGGSGGSSCGQEEEEGEEEGSEDGSEDEGSEEVGSDEESSEESEGSVDSLDLFGILGSGDSSDGGGGSGSDGGSAIEGGARDAAEGADAPAAAQPEATSGGLPDLRVRHFVGGPCSAFAPRALYRPRAPEALLPRVLLGRAQRVGARGGAWYGGGLRDIGALARADGHACRRAEAEARREAADAQSGGAQAEAEEEAEEGEWRPEVSVFWGEACWSRTQLLGELARGSWGMCAAEAGDVFEQTPPPLPLPHRAQVAAPGAADAAVPAAGAGGAGAAFGAAEGVARARLWKALLRSGRLIYAPQTAMTEEHPLGVGAGDSDDILSASESGSEGGGGQGRGGDGDGDSEMTTA